MTDGIGFGRQGSSVYLTLSRPDKHNALTATMMEELVQAVARAADDDRVKSVVIAANGPVFCAGYDIADPVDFQGEAEESLRSRIRSLQIKATWMKALLSSPKPLIVSVQGACIGIGTYIALVADFVVAAEGASFGLPEERFGSAGATWSYPYLIREVGLKRANEILMTGRRFTAAEFCGMGLVNRVVGVDELSQSTQALCDAIGTLPIEGIALNRTVKSLALACIGHMAAFDFHPAVHPHAERLLREPGEFDFMAAVSSDGLRQALSERATRFGGEWWGW